MNSGRIASRAAVWVVALFLLSCGSHNRLEICDCTPTRPESDDFRHDAKHVPIPAIPPQEITVATMLTWPQTPVPPDGSPRTGRELQTFHIAHGFVQLTYENPTDCDIHMEISDTPDKTAPRVIVETPVDGEFCPARQIFQLQMQAHGVNIGRVFEQGELPQAIPVDVQGLAFIDLPHKRGSAQVQTIWELHPAIVRATQ